MIFPIKKGLYIYSPPFITARPNEASLIATMAFNINSLFLLLSFSLFLTLALSDVNLRHFSRP